MKCICGSGKSVKNCCGADNQNPALRTRLSKKFYNYENNKVISSSEFKEISGAKINTFRVEVLFSMVKTPLGEMTLPLLITHNHKALRPLTLDGVVNHRFENGKDVCVYRCMITPIHCAYIQIHLGQDVHRKSRINKNMIWQSAYLETFGNPFESLFSSEYKNGYIGIYHHTGEKAKDLILSSKYFIGSKWNFQGTNELIGYEYAYFTDISKIDSIFDLMAIGMCDNGANILIVNDNDEGNEIKVLRSTKEERKETLKVWVKPELLHINGFVLHKTKTLLNVSTAEYYSWIEMFCPNIYRIPVNADGKINFKLNSLDELFIDENASAPKIGFMAALGSDLEEIELLWQDNVINRKVFDLNCLNNEWKSIWENNIINLASQTFSQTIFK